MGTGSSSESTCNSVGGAPQGPPSNAASAGAEHGVVGGRPCGASHRVGGAPTGPPFNGAMADAKAGVVGMGGRHGAPCSEVSSLTGAVPLLAGLRSRTVASLRPVRRACSAMRLPWQFPGTRGRPRPGRSRGAGSSGGRKCDGDRRVLWRPIMLLPFLFVGVGFGRVELQGLQPQDGVSAVPAGPASAPVSRGAVGNLGDELEAFLSEGIRRAEVTMARSEVCHELWECAPLGSRLIEDCGGLWGRAEASVGSGALHARRKEVAGLSLGTLAVQMAALLVQASSRVRRAAAGGAFPAICGGGGAPPWLGSFVKFAAMCEDLE